MSKRASGATPRGGATDTTMLIWKVIHANPGITREQIFARIEREIPAGWAKRRYLAEMRYRSSSVGTTSTPTVDDLDIGRARRFALTRQLREMRKYGSIEGDPDGYRTRREMRYDGDVEKIDETGTKAAEHLNDAYALRTAEAAVARANPKWPRVTAAEWAAICRVVRAYRRSSGTPKGQDQ